MTVQTSVAAEPAIAVPGLVERTTKTPVILSRVCDEAAGIAPGLYVVRDGTDRKVDLPTAALEITGSLGGFVAFDDTRPFDALGLVANGEDIGLLVEGVIWVLTEEGVTQGEPVFARYAASGANTTLGKTRNDADTASCAQVPGCFFLDTITGAGLARVYRTHPL